MNNKQPVCAASAIVVSGCRSASAHILFEPRMPRGRVSPADD